MTRVPAILSTLRMRQHVARGRVGTLVAGAAIVVALAACGGSASPAPSAVGGSSIGMPSGTPAAASPTESSVAAGSSAQSGPSQSSVLSTHADPALEALLPAQVSGTPMQRSSATLAALLAAGGDRTAIDAFLGSIGKSEADGSFASAYDPTQTIGGGIFAFKIAGVTSDVLLPAIVSVEQSDLGAGATSRQANVAGKGVTVVSVGDGVNDTEWLLGQGDVVFVIHAPDEAHAATYLQALP